ncbi:hypothetical protein Y032_0017g3238 [Ancylostoma ceylanicum]|uniref:Uncharacterized protein n=1 Tax=Ancylostoma ceylanicum TaxID=53326 RepID=A0A016V463_9BILA|nr:hypothetical protein Y032_0017g3238 [Ancylostoma ceylanicum]
MFQNSLQTRFSRQGLYQFAGTNLGAKTYITVGLIDRIGEDMFTQLCCYGGQLAQLGAHLAFAPPRSGHFDFTKGGVFVNYVTLVVPFWNQRGKEITSLLIPTT